MYSWVMKRILVVHILVLDGIMYDSRQALLDALADKTVMTY